MAAGGEGGAVQDEVDGVLRCSETQLTGGVTGGCAIHPAMKPQGVMQPPGHHVIIFTASDNSCGGGLGTRLYHPYLVCILFGMPSLHLLFTSCSG